MSNIPTCRMHAFLWNARAFSAFRCTGRAVAGAVAVDRTSTRYCCGAALLLRGTIVRASSEHRWWNASCIAIRRRMPIDVCVCLGDGMPHARVGRHTDGLTAPTPTPIHLDSRRHIPLDGILGYSTLCLQFVCLQCGCLFTVRLFFVLSGSAANL